MRITSPRQVDILTRYLTIDERAEFLEIGEELAACEAHRKQILERAQVRRAQTTRAVPRPAYRPSRAAPCEQPVATMKPVRVSPKMAAWLAAQGERG